MCVLVLVSPVTRSFIVRVSVAVNPGAPVPGLAKGVAVALERGVRRNLPRVEREMAAGAMSPGAA